MITAVRAQILIRSTSDPGIGLRRQSCDAQFHSKRQPLAISRQPRVTDPAPVPGVAIAVHNHGMQPIMSPAQRSSIVHHQSFRGFADHRNRFYFR